MERTLSDPSAGVGLACRMYVTPEGFAGAPDAQSIESSDSGSLSDRTTARLLIDAVMVRWLHSLINCVWERTFSDSRFGSANRRARLRFHSIAVAMDTTSPGGRLVFSVFGAGGVQSNRQGTRGRWAGGGLGPSPRITHSADHQVRFTAECLRLANSGHLPRARRTCE